MLRNKQQLIVILFLTLLITVSPASAPKPLFTPSWKTGDWWLVKEMLPHVPIPGEPEEFGYLYWHFEVKGTEIVNGRDCYVVEKRLLPRDEYECFPGEKDILYFQKDNLFIVRKVTYQYSQGRLQPPVTVNYSYGTPPPIFSEEMRVPIFPLRETPKTVEFSLFDTDASSAYLRQMVAIKKFKVAPVGLKEGDAHGDRVLRSAEKVYYEVVFERGNEEEGKIVPVDFNLQMWCKNLPWRLYEEYGQYINGERKIKMKSWLIDTNVEKRQK